MTSSISTPNVAALSSFAVPPPYKQNQPLRRGTWTVEEEKYVALLIEEFKQGHLPLKEGMSLRFFLAKMVHCNPKRISKKFEGSNYNGKQLYEQSDKVLDPEEAQGRRTKLEDLEVKFEESVSALRLDGNSRNKTALGFSVGGLGSGGAGVGASSALSSTSMSLSDTNMNSSLFPSRRHLGFPGGAGILDTTTGSSWLRGGGGAFAAAGLGLPGSATADSLGFPMPDAFVAPDLRQGLTHQGLLPGVATDFDSKRSAAGLNINMNRSMNLDAATLRDMVTLSNSGRALTPHILTAGSSNLQEEILAMQLQSAGRAGLNNLAGNGLAGGVRRSSLYPPSKFPGLSSVVASSAAAGAAFGNVSLTPSASQQLSNALSSTSSASLAHFASDAIFAQDFPRRQMVQQQQRQHLQHLQLAEEDCARRRLMGMLNTNPAVGVQAASASSSERKRASDLPSGQESDAKKQRFY